MTDWSHLGAGVEQAFEAHRQRMVDHFIRLRHMDADYARGALASYVGMRGCPFPKIADDVKAQWAIDVAAKRSAEAETEPAGSR